MKSMENFQVGNKRGKLVKEKLGRSKGNFKANGI
jgi:hypothetical protein